MHVCSLCDTLGHFGVRTLPKGIQSLILKKNNKQHDHHTSNPYYEKSFIMLNDHNNFNNDLSNCKEVETLQDHRTGHRQLLLKT